MRAGPFNWIAVKTTRQCPAKPDFKQERDQDRPLTIDDARNPMLPWLSAGETPNDYDDVLYATSWAHCHPPVLSIGAIQAPNTAPERPRRDHHKKV